MDSRETSPYGAWPSTLSAKDLAAGTLRLGGGISAGADGSWYWLEGRPLEAGRIVLVRRSSNGTVADAVPKDFNVRSLAHEYGGGSYTVSGQTIYAADFDSQRWYAITRGAEPIPITPAPATPRAHRYADACASPDGTRLYAVRERHTDQGVINEIVTLPTDGSTPPVVIAGGHDFVSTPRMDPANQTLVWLSWDHPRMPWDGTTLWQAPITASGRLGHATQVSGGPEESIFAPSWGPDGLLYYVSDRTGWWNLYRCEADGSHTALAPDDAEYGAPQWVFGMSSYVVLDDLTVVCVRNAGGRARLCRLSARGAVELDLDYTAYPGWSLATDGTAVVTVGASPTQASEVIHVSNVSEITGSPTVEVWQRSTTIAIDPGDISQPESLSYPSVGTIAHALYYPPTNSRAAGPAQERPPLLVLSHGGPTAQSPAALNLDTQYWTSRGFGVVDVNYGGSTGYGRAYRQRLEGKWGIVDLADCAGAATYLAERGDADPGRLAIRGGSAGGYTTLCALVFTDTFACGASYYGVADPALLAAETHKFESRYLDGLIGPWPAAAERYHARAPIHHLGRLSCPVLLLQGTEDAIVPPSQADRMAEVLAAKHIPYAYLSFEGEQHGFRRAESIITATEAELAFYGQVLGFVPAGDIPSIELISS